MNINITREEFEVVKARVDLMRSTMFSDKGSNDSIHRYFAAAALLISVTDELEIDYPQEYQGVAMAIMDVLERIHIPMEEIPAPDNVVSLFPKANG